MAASSCLRSRVTEIATCSICLDDFKDPRSLPCVHSFCLQCLQGHCKDKCPDDDVPCPLCRKKFQIPRDGVEALPHNFFLHNLVDAKTTKCISETFCCESCSKEGRTKPATVYCVDCSEKLCDRCSAPHKNWKGGAHDVRAMSDELSTELIWLRGSYCEKHSERRLEMFCFDCRGNVCMKCFADSHRDHKCEEIEKVSKDFVATIQSDIKPFPARITQFREAVKQAELANERFLENIKDIELKVQTSGEEMKRLVDDHVDKLMQELDDAKTSSVKETKIRVDGFELALTAMESFQAYSSQLTSKGSACDITRAADDLHARADELLKTNVTPGDYVPPDIDFAATGIENITGGHSNIIGCLKSSTLSDGARVPAEPIKPAVLAAAPRDRAMKYLESERQQYLQSAAEVTHVLREDIRGLTVLNNELYVLRDRRDIDQVDVYSTADFTLLRRLNVGGLARGARTMQDIASCVRKQCVYVAEWDHTIHRIRTDKPKLFKSVSKWPVRVKGKPQGLSVTRSCNVLVTCMDGKLIELSSKDGKTVREITLQSDILWPKRAIQLVSNQYIVCHGNTGVSLVGSDGRFIRSHSEDVELSGPCHAAVNDDEFVFVADCGSKQIVLFDPSLNYLRGVLQRMESAPCCLCFEDDTHQLYVGHCDGTVSIVRV